MVSPEVLLMLSLLDTGLLLFLAVYFMITLSDLESDYINSRQCSERLNRLTWPRAALLVLLCLLALPSPLLLLPPLPPTLWLLYKATHVPPGATMVHHPPPGNSGLYEPTEVHVRAVLQGKLQESLGEPPPLHHHPSADGTPHGLLLPLHVAAGGGPIHRPVLAPPQGGSLVVPLTPLVNLVQ